MSAVPFNAYSKYYDLLYQDKDYDGETEYIVRLLRELAPDGRRVLELGSGTFRHARRLVDRGYQVHGVERSADMIAVAAANPQQGLTWEQADISRFATDRTFDIALSLFHVISYLTGNDELIACFQRVQAVLPRGGIFIFDVWYGPAVLHQQPEARTKRMENESVQVLRRAEPVLQPNANVVDVHYHIEVTNREDHHLSTLTETHSMRYFSTPEVDLLARHCGFSLLRAEEFLTAAQPGPDTWGVCYLLKKN